MCLLSGSQELSSEVIYASVDQESLGEIRPADRKLDMIDNTFLQFYKLLTSIK